MPGLSRFQFWGILLLVLVAFVAGAGRIWEHPWDIDASVWLSYLLIPPLVAGCLAFSRRLRWGAFLLGTLEVALVKFAITYVAATALWAASGEPPKQPSQDIGPRPLIAQPVPVRTPTPFPPGTTGTITGTVHDPSGAPLSGAMVYLVSGLERFVFAAPAEPVHIEHDGRGFVPPLVAVEVGQPVRLRSTDRRLHTLRAIGSDGRWVFNAPILASGIEHAVNFSSPLGLVTIGCTVHGHAGTERPGYLVVLAHPFHALTGADGAFRFAGVSAARLRIAVWMPGLGQVDQGVELKAGEQLELRLDFPGS